MRTNPLASLIGCFLFSFAAHAQTFETEGNVQLKITISGLTTANGTVLVSLFDNAQAFPSDGHHAVRMASVKAKVGSVTVVVPNLPAGTYAISTFQDENDNGVLDTGSFGIPKEPFGFSNNPAIHFGAPSFDEAKLDLRASTEETAIRLNHM